MFGDAQRKLLYAWTQNCNAFMGQTYLATYDLAVHITPISHTSCGTILAMWHF